MPLEWKDADDVVARLGEKFMKRVLDNSGRGSSVRFGVTGSGQTPNYQVEVEERPRALFSGRSHKEWTGDEVAFEPHNLSGAFAFADLYTVFVKHFRGPLKTTPQSRR
ncbi:MAG: hypothetical protein KDI66_11755 [Xanthomonadales bacterium]|nr:hypothetical protein [Xanthomonadales bacterium]